MCQPYIALSDKIDFSYRYMTHDIHSSHILTETLVNNFFSCNFKIEACATKSDTLVLVRGQMCH